MPIRLRYPPALEQLGRWPRLEHEMGATMPWHSLRHTFGTECAARGVPIPVIKKLMGHSSISTTMRYVTVTDEQCDAAIRQAFGRLAGDKPAETKNAESAFEG